MASGSKDQKAKGGKAKDAKKKGAGPEVSPMEDWVSKAKGLGAVTGFAVAFWVCRGQGFSMPDAILRGLGGAIAMSLVAWRSALMIIQALMRSAAAQANREAEQAAAEAAAAQAAADAAFGQRPSPTPMPDAS